MQLDDIIVWVSGSDFNDWQLVQILEIWDDKATLVKSLDSGSIFRGSGFKLLTLEQADHELWVTIRQAETLRQEIKSQLNKKYNSNV